MIGSISSIPTELGFLVLALRAILPVDKPGFLATLVFGAISICIESGQGRWRKDAEEDASAERDAS